MSDHWAKPFCCIPVVAAKDERLTKTALRVLMVLAYHANRVTGACTVKLETLVAETDLARCKVAAATALLVRLGWLRKTGKGGRSRPSNYHMMTPETLAETVTVTEAVTVTESSNEKAETMTESVSETLTEAVKGKEQINYPERKEEKDKLSVPPAAMPAPSVHPDLALIANAVHHPPDKGVKASHHGREPESRGGMNAVHPSLPPGASPPRALTEAHRSLMPVDSQPPKATVMQLRGVATPGRTARRFDEFWAVWPAGYKKDKKTCLAKWAAYRLDALADTIIADVVRRREADDGWKRGYVPNPETYLNRERWTDDIRPAPRAEPPRETAEERRQRERQAWAKQRQAELMAEEAARGIRHAIN